MKQSFPLVGACYALPAFVSGFFFKGRTLHLIAFRDKGYIRCKYSRLRIAYLNGFSTDKVTGWWNV